MGFMWQWRRGGGYIQGSHHCPPTTTTYYNNENNYVHFLGHLNSTGRPPLTKSWDYRCAICTASFCSAGDQTRTFMHARQAHYQLSYLPNPQRILLWQHITLFKRTGRTENATGWLSMLKVLLFSNTHWKKEGRKGEREWGKKGGRKEGWMNWAVSFEANIHKWKRWKLKRSENISVASRLKNHSCSDFKTEMTLLCL